MGAALAANYGPPASVQGVTRAAHLAAPSDFEDGKKILQIVVIGDYAIAEVHDPNQYAASEIEAYTRRGNRFRSATPGWHLAGSYGGVPAACWLEQYGFPHGVAMQIVARNRSMSAVQRRNPRAGC
jgi:hypothetical protein